MKLENRYLVLKWSDIDKYVKNYAAIEDAIWDIASAREDLGKAPIYGIFIDKRWPEYEPTLKLLSNRVDSE